MKTFFFCLLTLLLGLAAGLIISTNFLGEVIFPPKPGTSNQQPNLDSQGGGNGSQGTDGTGSQSNGTQISENEALLHQAYLALTAIRSRDYESLSSFVHPDGVTFTPFSTVETQTDRTLTASELNGAKGDQTLYSWGLWDGSGAPIEYTIADYFANFVYDADFIHAPQVGINALLSSGNSFENVAEAYPNAIFVEFYIPGMDPAYEGIDWCGLKLVFEPVDGVYKLRGIIHSRWTT